MGAPNRIPYELDWVTLRAGCSVGHVFNELRMEIENDVIAINGVKRLQEDFRFVVELLRDGTTIVIGQINIIPRILVKIGIVDETIMVKDEGNKSEWNARVTLNDEGRCVLQSDDGVLEHWQFRKRALQRLFFGDVE
jgi:hypothetical protein